MHIQNCIYGIFLYYDTISMHIQEPPYNYNWDVDVDFGSYENFLSDSYDSFSKQMWSFDTYLK